MASDFASHAASSAFSPTPATGLGRMVIQDATSTSRTDPGLPKLSVPAFSKAKHVGRPVVLDPENFMRRVQGVVERGWLTNNGPEVQEFEQRVAGHIGVRHCIATCNGTVALSLTAQCLQLRGEIIVPSFTFIATPHAFASIGLTPRFADVDPETGCIDLESVRSLIGPQTTAIAGVHLWGRTCEVEKLQQLADDHQLKLLFDASHAFGSTRNGVYVGGFGEAETFSFHATKYINAAEGGAVTTNSDELAARLRAARNFGFTGVDQVEHLGTNAKMNELSAAMGNASLDTYTRRLTINEQNFRSYQQHLEGIAGLEMVKFPQAEVNNYQYVVVKIDSASFGCDRDQLLTTLVQQNVLARRYFYPGCHRAEPYASATHSPLPNTELLSNQVLSLPTGPDISEEDVAKICKVIRISQQISASENLQSAPAPFSSKVPRIQTQHHRSSIED